MVKRAMRGDIAVDVTASTGIIAFNAVPEGRTKHRPARARWLGTTEQAAYRLLQSTNDALAMFLPDKINQVNRLI